MLVFCADVYMDNINANTPNSKEAYEYQSIF